MIAYRSFWVRVLVVGLLPAIAVAIVVSLVASFSARAQAICDVSWANPVSGNWNDSTKWDPAVAPVSTQQVCINATGGSYNVTLNVNTTIAGFSLDSASATFTASGRTFTVNGPSTLTTGDVVWRSSSWVGSGTLTNKTSMTFRGGSSISGSFVQDGTMVIQGNNTVGAASVTAAGGFTNRGRIVLESVGNVQSANLFVNGGTLVNAETGDIEVRAGSGGSRLVRARIDNRGVMELGAATVMDKGGVDHLNSGTINISGGNLTLSQSSTSPTFTNTGPINISPGRTFTVNNGVFTTSAPGIVTGDGSFVLNNMTLNFNGGAITDSPLLTSSRLNIGSGVMTGGAVFTMRGGGNNLSGTIRGNQSLVIQGHNVTGGASVTAGSDITNRGKIVLESVGNGQPVTLTVNGGTLVNAKTGDIEVRAGSGGSRLVRARIDNRGVMELGAATVMDKGGVDHLNSGTINISGGNLTLSQSSTSPTFTNTGPINVLPGRKLIINNGTFSTSAPGIVTGGGIIETNSVTVNFNGGAITQTPVLKSSTLNIGNGVMTGGAVFTMRGGGNNLSGTIRVNQSLVIQGHNVTGAVSVTASSGITNRGRIVLESVGNGQPVTLTVNGGTLVNAETGDIEVRAGSGGSRLIRAQIDNRGTFNVGANTTVGRSGAAHINDGSMIIDNAAVTVTGTTLTNVPGGTISGAGTLNVSGVSFTNNGRVSPGLSPGVLNLTGNYTQNPTGALDIEIGGLVAGAGFDEFNVSGSAVLSGTLNINLVPGFVPVSGDDFRVLTVLVRIGQFGIINDTALGDGVSFEAVFDPSGLTLRASVVDVPVVVPGDVNGDGRVDSADLRIVMKRFNTGDADADVNRDGRVDILDLAEVAGELDNGQ